jgi:hypothetical protein
VQASDDILFLTFDEEVFNVTLNDLVGQENRDFATPLNFLTGRRYWRILFETVDPYYPVVGAVALGKSLKFERCPTYPSEWQLDTKLTEAARNPWKLKLNWEGLTEVDKEAFDERIAEHSDIVPIFIYDGDDSVLYNYKILRVFINRYEFKARRGGNDWKLTIDFEELL